MSHLTPPVKKTILVVDDEKNTRDGLRTSLEEDYEVYLAADAAGAQAVMETERVDLLLTDLRLGADSGMDLLASVLRQSHPPVCIMMTAYGTVDAAVEAMKCGAYDFVTKPVNIDRLDLLIKRALHGSAIERENVRLREQVEQRFGLDNFVGDSPAMIQVHDTIKQVAPSRATVLISGESGTGKNWRPKLSTGSVRATTDHLSRCIAPRSLRNCSRANFLATRKVPLPERANVASDASNRPPAAPFSSTKSARSTPQPR